MTKIIKKADNPKFQRINTIYKLLLNTTVGMTISELANKLDVSTKTIHRDLYEVLSKYGAIKNGRYWKIDPKIADDNLGANERIVLGILDQMAKNGGQAFYSRAHTLLSQVSQQLEHPIFTSVNSESLDDKNIELFEQIEQAIKDKNEITFKYQKCDFQVKPLKLVFFDGFWYMLCFDSKAKDTFKKFHLKSIQNLNLLKNSFEVSCDIEKQLRYANSIWFKLQEPFSVRLFVEKEIRKYFERKPLPSQMIVGKDKDGSIEIEIKITHEMEIIPIVFHYIPYIKVLEPQWLSNKIKKTTTRYLEEL